MHSKGATTTASQQPENLQARSPQAAEAVRLNALTEAAREAARRSAGQTAAARGAAGRSAAAHAEEALVAAVVTSVAAGRKPI